MTKNRDPLAGIEILGGLAACGQFYFLFGPRCRFKRCAALLPPGAARCPECGRKI